MGQNLHGNRLKIQKRNKGVKKEIERDRNENKVE